MSPEISSTGIMMVVRIVRLDMVWIKCWVSLRSTQPTCLVEVTLIYGVRLTQVATSKHLDVRTSLFAENR